MQGHGSTINVASQGAGMGTAFSFTLELFDMKSESRVIVIDLSSVQPLTIDPSYSQDITLSVPRNQPTRISRT
jgi:hypothetical protein